MTTGPSGTKSERLRGHVLALIENELLPHDKLPTERELAQDFEVSRLTARNVLGRLESEGRLYRVQGSGTFVSESRISKALELTSFSEDMRARGFVADSKLIAAESVPAGGTVGYALDCGPRTHVVHIRRVRTADGVPMALEDVFLPESLVPGLLDGPLDGSLYQALEDTFKIRVESAEQSIRAVVLEPAEAKLLHAPQFSAAFLVTRTGSDARGRAVEYARSLYRGDRYSYELTVHRTARPTDRD